MYNYLETIRDVGSTMHDSTRDAEKVLQYLNTVYQNTVDNFECKQFEDWLFKTVSSCSYIIDDNTNYNGVVITLDRLEGLEGIQVKINTSSREITIINHCYSISYPILEDKDKIYSKMFWWIDDTYKNQFKLKFLVLYR